MFKSGKQDNAQCGKMSTKREASYKRFKSISSTTRKMQTKDVWRTFTFKGEKLIGQQNQLRK
eukprot:scaffold418240_cov15-Prasinocladus_malaysianus.AAC.1